MHTYIFCDYFSCTDSVWQGALERIPAVSGKTQRQKETNSELLTAPSHTDMENKDNRFMNYFCAVKRNS